jgi:hypothetical protein
MKVLLLSVDSFPVVAELLVLLDADIPAIDYVRSCINWVENEKFQVHANLPCIALKCFGCKMLFLLTGIKIQGTNFTIWVKRSDILPVCTNNIYGARFL